MGSVSTTVKVEENQVTIIRHGAIKMNHTYRLGEKTISMYHTGQGALEMAADTTRLEYTPLATANQVTPSAHLDSRDSCGVASRQAQLTLSYALSMQQQFVGQFTLQLSMLRRESRME